MLSKLIRESKDGLRILKDIPVAVSIKIFAFSCPTTA